MKKSSFKALIIILILAVGMTLYDILVVLPKQEEKISDEWKLKFPKAVGDTYIYCNSDGYTMRAVKRVKIIDVEYLLNSNNEPIKCVPEKVTIPVEIN